MKNFDIDIDFENKIPENIDIEQKFDIVPCLLQTLKSEGKEDAHAFIRYGGNGEVYLPPTSTRPLGITRPLPDITPSRLRPSRRLQRDLENEY